MQQKKRAKKTSERERQPMKIEIGKFKEKKKRAQRRTGNQQLQTKTEKIKTPPGRG